MRAQCNPSIGIYTSKADLAEDISAAAVTKGSRISALSYKAGFLEISARPPSPRSPAGMQVNSVNK